MIRPEELRKGNLINGVYYTEGFEDDEIEKESVCDFLGYNPHDNYLWVSSKDHIEEFDRFEPIPLTEEWLLKLGFKSLGFNNYRLDKKEYNVQATFHDCWFIEYVDNRVEVQCIIEGVKSVHNLQNIFYVMSNGEELTLKE